MEWTWDELPVARERPFACCVVVWREGAADREFLGLQRSGLELDAATELCLPAVVGEGLRPAADATA